MMSSFNLKYDYKTCVDLQRIYINRFESIYNRCKRKNFSNRNDKRYFLTLVHDIRKLHQILLCQFNVTSDFVQNRFESKVNELIQLYDLKLLDYDAWVDDGNHYGGGNHAGDDDNNVTDSTSKERTWISNHFGQLEPMVSKKELLELFRKLTRDTNRKGHCPACFYIGYRRYHTISRCKSIELAYEVYKQNENVLLSNKTLSDSYSDFDNVSDYDGDTLLFVNSGRNQTPSKILHPKPIIAHVGNKFKHNSIANQSESLTKSMDELAISNCLNTDWKAGINRSLSSPMISIDSSTIMVNLISKCKNQMEPSIKAMLNYDFNANYILRSFLDNLKNNFNYGDIKFDDFPKDISKRIIYKRIGIISINVGIGLFHESIEFIVLDGDKKRLNDNGFNDIFRNLHRFGMVISCEELKKFLINISKNTSSYNIDLKQSVKMIDYCFKNLVNANGCTVTIPPFIPSLLPQTISNDTEEMKEIILGSGIHFKVKPMNPISNPWMNKLLRARILAPIIHQLDHVSQSMPIQINVKNVPIETDITAISTAYCIDPNIKIYYHFETAIADGLVSIESQENVAKYDNVIIYLIVGEFPSTSLQKLDNNNEQCDATTHRSLLFKFQPSNFIIIEKINTFDDCDESRELLIANYIRINVKPKCP